MADEEHQRPKEQWWLDLRPILKVLAQPAPRNKVEEIEVVKIEGN
jgi:hypothetical protein